MNTIALLYLLAGLCSSPRGCQFQLIDNHRLLVEQLDHAGQLKGYSCITWHKTTGGNRFIYRIITPNHQATQHSGAKFNAIIQCKKINKVRK